MQEDDGADWFQGSENNETKPIAGGQLFREYLFDRFREDFERGWVAKEAAAAAAATKAMEDQAVKAANEMRRLRSTRTSSMLLRRLHDASRVWLCSLESYSSGRCAERIIHECVKKLLGNVNNPEI